MIRPAGTRLVHYVRAWRRKRPGTYEESYATALRALKAFALTLRSDGTIVAMDAPDREVLPCDPHPSVGTYWPGIFSGFPKSAAERAIRDASEGRTGLVEFSARSADESEQWYECRVIRISKGFFVLVREVSERQRFMRVFLDALHREQQRLAAELHDRIGGQFSGSAMMVAGLVHDLREGRSVSPETMEEVLAHLHQGMEETRALSRGLNHYGSESRDFAAILRDFVARVKKQSRLNLRLHETGSPYPLSAETGRHLSSIAQEMVNNALRHSRATDIDVRLDFEPDKLTLIVEDNGIGLPPNSDSPGIGLKLMTYRAHLIGAVFHAEPRDGGGTRASCIINRSPPARNISPGM